MKARALWERHEVTFTSAVRYENPLQEATLTVTFRAPSGAERAIEGFWDGGLTWRVRFRPDEPGEWRYSTACSDVGNSGLHGQSGAFRCTGVAGDGSRFARHGPLGMSANRRHLAHADGTPFLWLGDTGWNAALQASDEEWQHYAGTRQRQGFTGIQFVPTNWFMSPAGDRDGELGWIGRQRLAVNPLFFQRMDRRVDSLNRMGLAAALVLLWSSPWQHPLLRQTNPGLVLPVDQAVLLARYEVARWGASDVLWILNGDGDYRGEKAERWRQIGRAVFGDRPHAPVTLHPCGVNWPYDDFSGEAWLDIAGYQSGHDDGESALRWLVQGPPASEWRRGPVRAFMNIEPPYENHHAYSSKQPLGPHTVRRALYWSLLVSPTAGFTYGGHGVWGWDDGTQPPFAHPHSGTPLPWREALTMPAAGQVAHIAALFGSLDWPRLVPAPELLAWQPGESDVRRTVAAARTPEGDLAVLYLPEGGEVELRPGLLREGLRAEWFDPRTGLQREAKAEAGGLRYLAPGAEDWVLVMREA
ncbi:MAG: DUF4038 domain-containing protein [Anaerolineae bacterium]|nr:DUF4038 domain-containing protein [Anaerolineae bacterium]